MRGDKGMQLFGSMSTLSMGKGKKIVWYSLLKEHYERKTLCLLKEIMSSQKEIIMPYIFPVDDLFISGRILQLRGERLLQNSPAPCREAVEQQNARADKETETRAIFKSRKERFWQSRFHTA